MPIVLCDIVQELPTNSADQPLYVSVSPRRSGRCHDTYKDWESEKQESLHTTPSHT